MMYKPGSDVTMGKSLKVAIIRHTVSSSPSLACLLGPAVVDCLQVQVEH